LFRDANLPVDNVLQKCAPRHFTVPEELILPKRTGPYEEFLREHSKELRYRERRKTK
jgi:hypothetical protein